MIKLLSKKQQIWIIAISFLGFLSCYIYFLYSSAEKNAKYKLKEEADLLLLIINGQYAKMQNSMLYLKEKIEKGNLTDINKTALLKSIIERQMREDPYIRAFDLFDTEGNRILSFKNEFNKKAGQYTFRDDTHNKKRNYIRKREHDSLFNLLKKDDSTLFLSTAYYEKENRYNDEFFYFSRFSAQRLYDHQKRFIGMFSIEYDVLDLTEQLFDIAAENMEVMLIDGNAQGYFSSAQYKENEQFCNLKVMCAIHFPYSLIEQDHHGEFYFQKRYAAIREYHIATNPKDGTLFTDLLLVRYKDE